MPHEQHGVCAKRAATLSASDVAPVAGSLVVGLLHSGTVTNIN